MAKPIFLSDDAPRGFRPGLIALGFFAFGAAVVLSLIVYLSFRIEVPPKKVAVLTRLTGIDLENGDEVAPTPNHKGVQREVLPEGRYFYNPVYWDGDVIDQIEIPEGKLGVLVSQVGEDLAYGEFLARVGPDGQVISKGIVPDPLRPGRYPINPYLFKVEPHDPVVIPGGYKGVVTNLAGPLPKTENELLSANGERGVQPATLEAGTYYINPYVTRVNLIDCRSQRFNLSQEEEIGFPSKDGFWVSLDGVIEFRVQPLKAPEIFIVYNEDKDGDALNEELIRKVILPNARSFCRLEGANKLGRDFIAGDSRSDFQEKFQTAMRRECEPLGIEIIQALITRIIPPQEIAAPVRDREIAKQKEEQYRQQILQQKSEEKLAIQKALVKRSSALVAAEQEVVKLTTQAEREQEIAVTKAEEGASVAQFKLDASQDEASAISTRGKAAAEVVQFKNKADAAGWKRAVAAFHGDGGQYAQFVLYQKLSSAYRDIMVNTADSPIMKIFDTFGAHPGATAKPVSTPATAKNE